MKRPVLLALLLVTLAAGQAAKLRPLRSDTVQGPAIYTTLTGVYSHGNARLDFFAVPGGDFYSLEGSQHTENTVTDARCYTRLSLVKTTEGKRQVLAKCMVTHPGTAGGLRMEHDRFGTRLTADDGQPVFKEYWYSLEPPPEPYCNTFWAESRDATTFAYGKTVPVPPTPTLATGAESKATARADPRTGLWRYFDQTAPSERVRVPDGLELRLTGDPDTPGCYLLTCTGTAGQYWQTGQVKARMTPTPFAGHYDLTWHDDLHRPHRGWATFSGTDLLSIELPALDFEFRMYRVH